jgi:dipeptidyl aminopeptidase/acylaminoacyl peptidase
VLFVDRPDPASLAGIWGVDLLGGPPVLVTERLGLYSPDGSVLAYPQNGVTVIERPSDGQSWIVDNGARPVAFSPDSTRLAWTGGQNGPPFDTARREIWTSLADGSQARELLTLFGGGLAGWLSDQSLLVTGRLQPGEEDSVLWILPIDGGEPVELLRGPRLRRLLPSPQGGWLAHQVTFSDDPNGNGLWVADLAGGGRFRLDLFGAYRWRAEGLLLVIPLDMGAASHQLWELDVARGALRALTDPAVTPFKIANGDWSVSPDGRHIAFVSAEDHNIWLLTLPPPQS